ncbi:hypothetical protein POX_c04468 [Penicillium oxalicum]|nr:hypothetical protein POX_c04468 [Penicillium oxalicum]KAI2791604.1 hypothetical protein POX_c04468 [Penicillium oxalicum]
MEQDQQGYSSSPGAWAELVSSSGAQRSEP